MVAPEGKRVRQFDRASPPQLGIPGLLEDRSMQALAPAIALMRRVTFPIKFAITGAFFLLALLFFGAQSAMQAHDRVQGLQAEAQAIALYRALLDLNLSLLDSRRLAVMGDVGGAKARFASHVPVVERQFAELDRMVASDAQQFDFSPKLAQLHQSWSDLVQHVKALPEQPDFPAAAFAAHAKTYNLVYASMKDLGDMSGITFEADPDLFFLGFSLLDYGASTAGISTRLQLYSEMVAQAGVSSEANRRFLQMTLAAFNDGRTNFGAMLMKATELRPELKPHLSRHIGALDASSAAATDYINGTYIAAQAPLPSSAQAHASLQPFVDASWQTLEAVRLTTNALIGQRQALAQRTMWLVVAGVTGVIGVSLYLYTALFVAVRHSLTQANEASQAIARGELGCVPQVEGDDEFAQLLRSIAQADLALQRAVGQVRGAAEAVAASTLQIAQGNTDLSSRTEQQSSSLQQTASAMIEVSGAVRDSAANASLANDMAADAASKAQDGGRVVKQAVASMEGIHASSQKIAEIIGVIDGIAFQTNILALNAAVEAARAGEQGRGFAVVASEVRNLAQRSAESAREIKVLIASSVERVDQGRELVNLAGQTMSGVVDAIARVSQVTQEIRVASDVQAASLSEVTLAVGQMDDSTQQNAALVEQMTSATTSLNALAQDLVGAVGVFRVHDARSSD